LIIVAVEVVVEEGAIAKARDAIADMERESRKEPGCIRYAFSVDVSDPTILRVIEFWKSMEDLEKHFVTPHMAAFGAAVASLQPKSMSIKGYEAGREVKLPGS
jgi:quinol monooxygenase YgiN